MTPAPARAARLVVLAGAVGATCDIVYAILYYGWKGVSAERILQTVASGLLGKSAYDGGWPAAALGLALHYGIVIVAAALFFGVARRWAWLRDEPVTAGLAYGVAIYGVMNFIVLPLSAYPYPMRFPLLTTATGLLAHMLVGLSISLVTRRAHSR
ncbi:hypothetical protein [Scleromatobacter humisilvae]|uniref:DUF1440 domain-containing protein n=1 Tax=Scleromatobacter humisilvae TaxID=2897159 RepID=A0A9X2BYF7_9BURK|nr:hypothetical protein [Scleromatobacter humisilvae]MCK9684136.1 DUF1440 domain-containing protein [Scleromatobacter humisilvae]